MKPLIFLRVQFLDKLQIFDTKYPSNTLRNQSSYANIILNFYCVQLTICHFCVCKAKSNVTQISEHFTCVQYTVSSTNTRQELKLVYNRGWQMCRSLKLREMNGVSSYRPQLRWGGRKPHGGRPPPRDEPWCGGPSSGGSSRQTHPPATPPLRLPRTRWIPKLGPKFGSGKGYAGCHTRNTVAQMGSMADRPIRLLALSRCSSSWMKWVRKQNSVGEVVVKML